MDLSQLSDSDLHALQAGDLSKVSDEGLQHLHAQHSTAPTKAINNAPDISKVGGPNAAQAQLEGFGQTATMGYLPQLQAAAAPAIYGAMNKLTGQDIKPDSYVNERDNNIRRQQRLSDESPIASAAGKGAGVLASGAMLPSGGGSLLKTAATGALTGAAYNPGDKEGVVDPAQAGDRAINGAVGGTAALALGLGQKAFSGGKGAIQDYLTARADARNPGRIDDVAQQTLNDVIKRLPAAESEKVYAALRDKNFELNPKDYMGISPEVDQILQKYTSSKETPFIMNNGTQKMVDTTGNTQVSGADVYNARKGLDAEARRRSAPGALIQQRVSDSNADAAERADSLRRLLRGDGGPKTDVAEAIGSLQGAVQDAQSMQRSGKYDPVRFFDDPSLGKAGLMQNADKALGTDMQGVSRRITNASDVHAHPYKSIPKIMTRGLSRGLDQPVSSEAINDADKALFEFLRGRRSEK